MKKIKVIIKQFVTSLLPNRVGDVIELTVEEYVRYKDYVEKYADGPPAKKQVTRGKSRMK